MEQIPDADYIREAEQMGVPPFQSIDEHREVISHLNAAKMNITYAVNDMQKAMNVAGKEEDQIYDLSDKLDDIRYEIVKLIYKLKQGGN